MDSIGLKSIFLFLFICNFPNFARSVPQNYSQRIKDIVNEYGYPFEIHHVDTEDGYTLELHRIPYGSKNNKSEGEKPVAYLKHGLIDSSTCYLTSGPNNALAYLLADKGYDVWVGNSRGNFFCRKHKIYSENDRRFWNFSLHEIGLYDNTAMIDYILKTTNQKKVFHVCHSQGCGEFYVMTSLRPEYNNKISLSVNLAPAVFFGHPSSSIRLILTIAYLFKDFFAKVGYMKVIDQDFLFKTVTTIFCRSGPVLRPLCYLGTSAIHGFDWFQTDMSLLPKFWELYPAGSSIKQIIHFAVQLFYPNTFRQFDYGNKINLEVYNSTIPPKYPLEKVTAPVVLFAGDSDNAVSVQDVKTIAKSIPNVVENTVLRHYNHVGYMLHINIRKIVYEKVLKLFETYKNK